MAEVTLEQLENAGLDAETIEIFTNGAPDRVNPGHQPGTVTSRLARTYPVLSKIAEQLMSGTSQAIYVDAYIAAAGQLPGVEDNTEPLLAAHADFCALGRGATIVYGSPFYVTSAPLPCPDEYFWTVMGLGFATITQTTPDTPILDVAVTKSRGLYQFANLRFQYGTLIPDQPNGDSAIALRNPVVAAGNEGNDYLPTGEINSIAICVRPLAGANAHPPGDPESLVNGMFQWRMERVHFENCFRGLSERMDSLTTFPYAWTQWGCHIDGISFGGGQRGAILHMGSTGEGIAGGPMVIVDNLYGASMVLVEPAVAMRGLSQIKGRNWEFNISKDLLVSFDTCLDIQLEARFENCDLTFNESQFITINGGMTNAKVEIEFVSIQLTNGATKAYGLLNFGGAHVDLAVTQSPGVKDPTGFYHSRVKPFGDYQGSTLLTRVPQFREVFTEGVYGYAYESVDAPRVRFPNSQSFSFYFENITTNLNSGLDLAACTCENGLPIKTYVMNEDGFIYNLSAEVTADVTAGYMFVNMWKVSGGVASGIEQFYCYFAPYVDKFQSRYAVIPYDPGNPIAGQGPIVGHYFRKGDRLMVTLTTSDASNPGQVDFAPTGIDVSISAMVTYLAGTQEIPTLKALELDDYSANTGGWSANILKKTPGSVITIVNSVGGKYSIGGSGENKTLVGAGLTAGADVPVVRETLGGATGNPKNSFLGITVA